MTTPPFNPRPCPPADGGSGGPVTFAAMLNYSTLCDVNPDTGVVYNVVTQKIETDDEGNPIGFTYYDATTGTEYQPQGEISDCSVTRGPEIQVLCEFKTNGDVIQFVRRYTELDSGQTLVGDSSLDGDQSYDVDPTSTVGLCPQTGGCDPITVTGLCLPGGSPIAVVMRRDCEDGSTTLDGYVSLLSGTFTAGPPPVGTVACGGTQSVQVSGTFCSVDTVSGDVLALVLVEYTYGEDGAIVSTRLVNAIDGTTYIVPAGAQITTCPTGTATPESSTLSLCDDNGPFLRDFRRDETGALVSFTDYTLSLTPYVPVGTVKVCEPGCCPEAVAEVCLANGHKGAIIRSSDGGLLYLDVITGGSFTTGDVVPCEAFISGEPVVLCYLGPGGTDDVRRFLRHFRYGTDGTVEGFEDTTLDGAPLSLAPGAAFACGPVGGSTYPEVFNVVPGTPWTYAATLAGKNAESVTVTVLSGPVTVDGSGSNPPVVLPTGASLSWTRSDSSSVLAGPTSITAGTGGHAIVIYTANVQLP